MSEPVVVELTPPDTYLLRLEVLRTGTPSADVAFEEDTWPGVMHLGLTINGEVVATSTWIPRELEGEAAVQLRGMATATHLQGRGLGATLLAAGCSRMADAGHSVVWARARDSAVEFYVRHGFEVRGEGFIDAATALPHHLVVHHLR